MQLDVTKSLRYFNWQTGFLTRIYLKKKNRLIKRTGFRTLS